MKRSSVLFDKEKTEENCECQIEWKYGFVNKDKLLWTAGGGPNASDNLGHLNLLVDKDIVQVSSFPQVMCPGAEYPAVQGIECSFYLLS